MMKKNRILLKKDQNCIQPQINTDIYNNYIYTIDGIDTTMYTPKRVKNDRGLSKYKVIEVNIFTKKSKKYTMKDYLAEEYRYYPVPGLVNTNILGNTCITMVPQGICKMDNYILITAYDSEGNNNSVIYALDENNNLKATLVYDKKCHMGGVTYDGKYLWIAEGNKSGLGAISKEELLGAINVSEEKNAKSVQLKNIIWQKVRELTSTSYCTYYDNKLWIGKFNKNEESHIYGYRTDYSKDNPKLIKESYIQAPKSAQGMCFYENDGIVYLAISASYGRFKPSVIRCYKLSNYNQVLQGNDGVVTINKGHDYKSLIIPPMLEQISIDRDTMYCIFESAARKYLMNMDGHGYSRKSIGSYIMFDVKKVF